MARNHVALRFKTLLRSYFQALTTWCVDLFSIIYRLMTTFIYIVASRALFIGIDEIGLTSAHYGMLLLIPYSG
ncbi:hypothetical protein [Coxiella-like endosymbiont of Rhipicephalus sanguineus]|uniref:hypothetical protein n=1 Tax=Coxiella-like endosymbiont of Rhipicephalus sanguineus TaxID=1955402 RepID=UPI00203C8155|nr:hypothetical protein [Coxiella-like endosymbiont of Rhipicephalus sanguineus]